MSGTWFVHARLKQRYPSVPSQLDSLVIANSSLVSVLGRQVLREYPDMSSCYRAQKTPHLSYNGPHSAEHEDWTVTNLAYSIR